MARTLETRREVWKVTEWRDGCAYRTAKIGEVWIPLGLTPVEENEVAKQHGGDMLCSVSSHDTDPIIRSRGEARNNVS
jgi:hypothetical protein